MRKPFSIVATLGALLFCAAPAAHASTAEVRLTNFVFQLVDLTPGDGSAAGVTWSALTTWAEARAQSDADTVSQANAFPVTLFADASAGAASAVASITPSAWDLAGQAGAAGTNVGGRMVTRSEGAQGTWAGALAPQTRLTVSFDYRLAISGYDHCTTTVPNPCSSAQATLFAYGQSSGGTAVSPNINLQRMGTPAGGGAAFADARSGSFVWVASNPTASPMNINLYIDASINGREVLTPVPEPTTAALAAIGLAGIAARVRRRRKSPPTTLSAAAC